MTLIFHPSLITYHTWEVRTWEEYKKRKKHNKRVKAFREAIWYKEPEYKEWEVLWKFAWYNILL